MAGSQSNGPRPCKIYHMNMQSAQVNQMTVQLKERIELLQMYYKDRSLETVRQ